MEFGDDRGYRKCLASHTIRKIKAEQCGCATAATTLSKNLHAYYFFLKYFEALDQHKE